MGPYKFIGTIEAEVSVTSHWKQAKQQFPFPLRQHDSYN